MPENIKTAWKVVRPGGDDDGWKSATTWGRARVTYRLGARSHGFEGTPVMVFRSKKAAKAFAWRGHVVLRGIAGNSRRQERLVEVIEPRSIRSFWKRGDAYRGETFRAPLGTHAADWFEPEKEVSQ